MQARPTPSQSHVQRTARYVVNTRASDPMHVVGLSGFGATHAESWQFEAQQHLQWAVSADSGVL